MKRIFVVMAVVILLCSCAVPVRPENQTPSTAIQEIAPDTSFHREGEELDVDVGDSSFAVEIVPDGYSVADFGEFTLLVSDQSFSLCAPNEAVTLQNGQFIGENQEEKRVIAELVSMEAVAGEAPFAPYDERYSDSVNTVDLTFGGFAAKKYHIQSQAEGPVPMKINTLYYCICLEDQVATLAFYPVMGMGGLNTVDMETVLDTIKLK